MDPTGLFAATALVVAACMGALWLLSLRLRNASIVDVFWGLGFVAIAAAALLRTTGDASPRRWLLAAMVALWGLQALA